MLEKCGSVAVLVSLRTILPVAASAMYRSIEKKLRSDRNAIQRPSGLIAGPTFSSPPSSSPLIDEPSRFRSAASSSRAPARRRDGSRRATRSDSSLRLDAEHALDGDVRRRPSTPAMSSICRTTSSPHRAADVRPERLAPAIGEVLRVVQLLDRTAACLLLRRVAQPHRGVRIDRTERQVLRHAFDEPERQAFGPVLPGCGVRVRRHVELERVHQLVADHVIGVGERAAERQDDPPPQRLGDAAGAFAELALNRCWSARSRRARRRAPAAAGRAACASNSRSSRACQRSASRAAMSIALALLRVEVDVEVLGLEDLEVEVLVLDLVAAEVLRRRWRRRQDHDHG